MAMVDFGTTRYCNLVADKQKNIYINACSGVGSSFHEGLLKKSCFHSSYSWDLQ